MAERLVSTDGFDTEGFARGHGSALPADHPAPSNTATLRAAVPVRSARHSNCPCSFRNGQVPQFDNDEVGESGDRLEDGNGENPEAGAIRAKMLEIMTKQYAAKSEEELDAAQLDYLLKIEEADTHLTAIKQARASRNDV
ncbi:hypothetical protein DL764_005086 [Monosporascus ibericus]|uniref:Uncharacterized protein n=1 Tax=Monosporascus ibericus TaxID=155417 RepID=A0A4Q4TA75_9PEZI|nr:hypothetical protein DL764_005086 [Monosporascus ibericus]